MRHARLALALAGLAAAGCRGKDRTPEGAAELFLRGTQEGDQAEVYRMLAPESQRELQERARVAQAQSGGRVVKPEHLLAVGREMPRLEVNRIRPVSVQGGRAEVAIGNLRKGLQETLQLERVGDVWRVILPKPPPAPASQPATRPASVPAASRPASP
jgi:hypothetical protein